MTEDRLRTVEQGQGRMETLLTEHVREQREMNQRLAEIVALLDISSSS